MGGPRDVKTQDQVSKKDNCVIIITDQAKVSRKEVKGVGVMKDEELKLEEIETSHTLGG